MLGHPSGTTQFINTGSMQIQDIKITSNTVFVVDKHRLTSWNLEGGMVSGIHEISAICADAECLTLSHDGSQIAFTRERGIFLYDIKAQEILKSIEWDIKQDNEWVIEQDDEWGMGPSYLKWDIQLSSIWFSPDGHQLCVIYENLSSYGEYLAKLDVVDDWSYHKENGLGGKWSLEHKSSHCPHHITVTPEWVIHSKNTKILWLPPYWRTEDENKVRWKGNFMALMDSWHPTPIIVEFKL